MDGDSLEININDKTENRAFNYALFLLSKKDYTCAEIRDKLHGKGYESSVCDKVVKVLKKDNYLNDERYCEKYISDKMKHTKYGENRIKYNLIKKGVDKDIISQKILLVDQGEEYEKALELACKKYEKLCEKHKLNSDDEQEEYSDYINRREKYELRIKIRKKVFQYLCNCGYSYDVANMVLGALIY